MIRIIFSILYLITITTVFAQSVSIATEAADVEYYRMPDEPLSTTYSTYMADIDINFSDLSRLGLTESDLIEDYLEFAGYKRVLSNGDVNLTTRIGDLIVWSEARNTVKTKKKDSEGNPITKITYNIEVKYSLPMSMEVVTRDGKTLMNEYIFTMSDHRFWTSPSYDKSADLESYWSSNKRQRINDLHEDLLEEGMKKISTMINERFGYILMEEKIKFETIRQKNHPEYAFYQKNAEILKNAFKLMQAEEGLDDVKTKAMPALTFYQESAPKYNSNHKSEGKLWHICIYNQALAWYWLEDFDKAEMLASELQKVNSKDKTARRLLEDIDLTQASLERVNRTSRHQVVLGSKT